MNTSACSGRGRGCPKLRVANVPLQSKWNWKLRVYLSHHETYMQNYKCGALHANQRKKYLKVAIGNELQNVTFYK